MATQHIFCFQRGIVSQRQACDNTLDVDADARAYSIASRSPLRPVLTFWDIAAAFPSLEHAFIWIVMDAMHLPLGFKFLLESMYHLDLCVIFNQFA